MLSPVEIVSLSLQDAYLCECGLISSSAIRCPCGNAHGLLCLSSALNREPVSASESYDRLLAAVSLLESETVLLTTPA